MSGGARTFPAARFRGRVGQKPGASIGQGRYRVVRQILAGLRQELDARGRYERLEGQEQLPADIGEPLGWVYAHPFSSSRLTSF